MESLEVIITLITGVVVFVAVDDLPLF